MDMNFELSIMTIYGLALFFLYFFGKLFLIPIKILIKLLLNSALGAVFIIMVNLIGEAWGFHIPINPLNALILGIFGVPGAIGIFAYFNLASCF